jgi:hypothetical protein
MRPLPTKTGLPRLDRASWEKGFSDGFRGLVWWPGAGIEPLSYSTGYTDAQAERDSHRQSSSPFAVPTSSSGTPGVGMAANTPREIVGKLDKGINAALADPKMKARIGELGSAVRNGASLQAADFGAELCRRATCQPNRVQSRSS